MKTLTRQEIETLLPQVDLIPTIEAGFVAYSAGRAVVPPVGELIMDNPPGDVHIKYGYIAADDHYVIKIASGFYDNPAIGLPSSNGLMLLFNQKTGELQCLLLDEGYLTDVRTAVAGAIAAKRVGPSKIERIGIVGTGIQARLQLQYLASVTDCRDVHVWGRSADKVASYIDDMTGFGFNIAPIAAANDLLASCNLIVTTTPASKPLLTGAPRPGTHITAVGADTAHKQELDASLLQQADVIVADSISQCVVRGEIYQALEAGMISADALIELGAVISRDVVGRSSDQQTTIADLTGVAVQDIQIAKAVYLAASQL